MTIGDMVVKLGLDPSGLNKGVSESRGILSRLGGSLASAALSGAGFAAGFMSLNAIASGAKWGISLAAEAEQAQVAFTTLLGSGEAAEQMLSGLTQFAADTPFDMPELKTAARQLAAFGVEADQIVPQLKMIGDIASGTGQPIAELAELYGKAKVQGRLFGEDINQLTGRGIPIISALAEQFGVAESEVKKLVEKGQVGFPELQRAFQSMTGEGGRFTGMMEAQSKTLAGVWGAFTDNASMAVSDFFTWMTEKMALRDGIAYLTEAMETTINLVSWACNNWGTVWDLTVAGMKLGIVSLWADLGHIFGVNVPELFAWLGKEATNIFYTWIDTVLTMYVNLGKNIRSIFQAIWDFISSGGTKMTAIELTPVFEGYRNSISSLPEFTSREMGELEQKLTADFAKLSGAANQSYVDFVGDTGGAALAGVELAAPTAGGGLATKSTKQHDSGPAAALQGSAEAYKLINNAFSQQQSSKEARAQKTADRILAEAQKTNNLLGQIAAGVSTSTVEEVDI